MIPAAWLIGAGLLGMLGVAAMVYNWDEVLDWLHNLLPKVSQMVKSIAKVNPEFKAAAMVVAGFVDAVHAQIEHKLYHKTGAATWMEETTRCKLPEKELPPNIRKKVMLNKKAPADISQELELELGMKI